MKIAIIGAGNMGGAIARGVARTAKGTNVIVSNPSAGKLDALKQEFPQIETTTDNCAAVAGADYVFLAVKPWKMEEVIVEIKPALITASRWLCRLPVEWAANSSMVGWPKRAVHCHSCISLSPTQPLPLCAV